MTASPSAPHTTSLLTATSEGDLQAASDLMPIVYDELRMLARSYLQRETPGHTLQATSLVHEAYLRLVDQAPRRSARAHTFSAWRRA
jgi:DNA-directed RNA polymerase specialized sigma24 family protein